MSVLLATHGRPALLRRALASVAAQTLSVADFEVVVIVNGPPGSAPDVVREARALRPGLQLRLLECRRPGVAHARQVGLWAARGEHVTILDDDDWIAPGFLAGLIAQAEPGVVPLGWLAESDHDGPGVPAGPDAGGSDRNNYLSRALERALQQDGPDGRLLRADEMPAAVSLNVGKLVPTALAREVRYDHDLRGGSDFVWWTGFFVAHPLLLRISPDRATTYVRTRGAGSLSRREVGWEFSVLWRLACIGALERLEPTTPEAERLVQLMADAQARHLRRYLEVHPEDRARVAAEVQLRGLRRVRWSVVNRDTATGLAIYYAFAPWNTTSALVAARRVRERGEVVDVVCQDLGSLRQQDPGAAVIADPWTDHRTITGGEPDFAAWRGVARFSRATFASLERSGRAGRYRTLHSRAMWVASHVVASQYKLRHPEVHWVAEMSDPLSRTILGEVRSRRMQEGDILTELRDGLRAAGFTPPEELNVNEWAELLAYALADEIVFTNELQRDYMLGYSRDPRAADRARSLARVSAHPTLDRHLYDATPVPYALSDDRVHLAYFGVFYATRGLTEVTGALASLGARTRSRVRLHVFTTTPDEIRADVRAHGLADVVVVEGYRPFLGFLNLTTQFDVLVVNDAVAAEHHGGINPYLPSKVSDYRGSGTPVWGVYEPGSMLSGLKVDHRSALGDVEAAAAVLTGLVRDRFGSGPDGTGEDGSDALAGVAVPQRRGGPFKGAVNRKSPGGSPGQ